MDIFEALHAEHESVDEQLAELVEGGRDDETFETLRIDFIVHALAEEQVFYRRLETRDETAALVREGHREHRQVMRLLDDMSGSDEPEDTWRSHLQTLRDDVRRHIEGEEGRLFPPARRLIQRQEAERLAGWFQRAKGDIAA